MFPNQSTSVIAINVSQAVVIVNFVPKKGILKNEWIAF